MNAETIKGEYKATGRENVGDVLHIGFFQAEPCLGGKTNPKFIAQLGIHRKLKRGEMLRFRVELETS